MLNIRNICWILLATFFLATPVSSHEISPTIVSALISEDFTSLELEVEGNLEALISKIGSEHEDTEESPQAPVYNALRAKAPEALNNDLRAALSDLTKAMNLNVDGQALTLALDKAEIPAVGDTDLARLSTLHFSADLPEGSTNVIWSLDEAYGASVFRLSVPGEERVTEWLQGGNTSRTFDIKEPVKLTFFETVVDYIKIGFVHIVPKGLDHILFVIGLFLISPFLRPLMWQVTAFTVAHTIKFSKAIKMIDAAISGSTIEPGTVTRPKIPSAIVMV